MDNGADWHEADHVRPRGARVARSRLLDAARARRLGGLLLTGKPFVFAAGADIDEFPGDVTPERAREGGRAGHELFGRLRALPYPTRRRGQRRRARRRRRDRAALRLPHDFVGGSALRLPRGVPRDHPRLGRNAADPAPGRCGGGRAFRRREPAPPEPHAHRAAGVRGRVRGRAARAGRVPRRVAGLSARERSSRREASDDRASTSPTPRRSAAGRARRSTIRYTVPHRPRTAHST